MIISVCTYIVSLLNYPTPRTRQLPSLFALNLGSQNRPSSHRFGPQADASGHLQNKTSSCPSDQLGVDIRDGSTALETWKTHIGKKAGVTLEHYSTVKNIWLGFMNIQYLDPRAWVPCVAVFGKAVCVFGVGSLAQVLCLHLDLRSAAKAVWNAKSLPVSSPLLPKSWWQSCLGFGLAPTLLKTRIPWREQVVAAVLLKLPPYLTTRLEILKETDGLWTTVLHQLQIHVIELLWCWVVGHVWNPLHYIRMLCLVWECIRHNPIDDIRSRSHGKLRFPLFWQTMILYLQLVASHWNPNKHSQCKP